jgi:4-amino-4-deoxy-L-arabinose transferase-like glycosyltransferase
MEEAVSGRGLNWPADVIIGFDCVRLGQKGFTGRLLVRNMSSETSCVRKRNSPLRFTGPFAQRWTVHVALLMPVMLVYYCLAFYRIGEQSLWVDEVFTALAVHPEHSFFEVGIWRLGSRPLYFTLLHGWAQFGTSEIALRSFSAIVGGIGVVLIYMVALQLFDLRVAGIAAVLFATSPFLIWYSQEVRYITLLITTSLFAMYAYHRALKGRRFGAWLAYGCSLVIAIGAFLTNVLLIVTHALCLIAYPSRSKTLRLFLACQVLVFLLFAWWANEWRFNELGGYWERLYQEITVDDGELTSVPKEQRFSRGGRRDFDWGAVPYTLFTLSAGFSLGPSVQELQMDRSLAALTPHVPTIGLVTMLFGGLFAAGVLVLRRQWDKALLLGLWLAIPLLVACVVSAGTQAAFNVRYVSMLLPAYILVLAVGIVNFRSRTAQHALLGCLLAFNCYSLANYYFNPRYAREDARAAARYLAMAARYDDAIVIVGSSVALKYYYAGPVPLHSWSEQNGHTLMQSATSPNGITSQRKRLWLVETRRWEKDRSGRVRGAVEQTHQRLAHRQFPGVDIYSYELGNRHNAKSNELSSRPYTEKSS